MTTKLLSDEEIELVQASFAALKSRLPELVDVFYTKLFAANPSVRRMFPDDMSEQQQKLAATLKIAVAGTSDLQRLVPALQALGAKHANYGVTPGHFDAVGAALLDALGTVAGPLWTAELEYAWATTYGLIASVMIEAMESARAA